MILAVLDARAGVSLSQHDVYLNVAGGLRLKEPAADLAVAAALLSSMSDTIIPPWHAVCLVKSRCPAISAPWARPKRA